VVFGAVAYAFLITMASTTLPTPLYVLYRTRFGFSELMVTVIFATYAVGVIAALLLFGRLSDEVGRRRTLVPGILLSALSALAFLLAHGLVPLLVGRALSGLSAGIFTGTATAALIDLAPPHGQARATLVATMVNMGGLGLGPLLSGLLVQWAGLALRLTFWVDLALLVPALVAVLLIPEPPAGQRRWRVRPQALSVPREVRPVFVRAALAGFAGFAVLGMFTAVSPAFLAGLLHERSHALLGVVVCVVFLASMAGQLALNRVPGASALSIGSGVLVVGALLIALSLAVSSLLVLVLGGVVAGFGQGLSFRAGLTALNADAPADHRAEVASSFFVVAYVALSIPVIGVGLLAEAAGLRTAGLVFTIAVAALAAVVLVMVRRESRGRVIA
jgi:predicted MFS family arabinose efflux permease